LGSNNDSSITAEVDDRLESFFGDEEGGQKEAAPDTSSSAEVDNRLDDLFGGSNNEPADDGAQNEPDPSSEQVEHHDKPVTTDNEPSLSYSAENSILKDLKSVVLSLEWEITDQVMQRLNEEIANLEKEHKDDKVVVAFLQLLGSLGKYIQKKRAEAHPDSISLLNSVYDSMEKVMLTEDLTEAAKKKMLIAEVNKYKQLKEQIATMKPPPPRKFEPSQRKVVDVAADAGYSMDEEASVLGDDQSVVDLPSQAPSDIGVVQTGDAMVSNQELISALSDIQQTIQAGFDAIREELRLLRDQQK